MYKLKEVLFIGATWILFQSLMGEAVFYDESDIYYVIAKINNVKEQTSSFVSHLNELEERVKSFTNAMKWHYGDVNSYTTKMLKEFRAQSEQLPKSGVPIRSTCSCEHQLRSPCPERCINSCRLHYQRQSRAFVTTRNNCESAHEKWNVLGCQCYYGSSQSCMMGNGRIDMSLCYDANRGENIDTNCLDYAINSSKIEESAKRFSKISIEPQKILVRNLEFNFTSLYEWTEFLYDMTDDALEICKFGLRMCNMEFANNFEEVLKRLQKDEKYITQEMTNIKNQANESSRKLVDLREQMFALINASVKKYNCCLRNGEDSSGYAECASDTTESFVEPADRGIATDSLCDHRRCILVA